MEKINYNNYFNKKCTSYSIEKTKLEYVANIVSLEIGSVFKDIHDLMHRRTIVHFLNEQTVENLNEVKETYLLFSKNNPQYDQLRLLTKDGQELLRINSSNGQSWAVPGNELQIKSDRYYFKNSTKYKTKSKI